MLVLLPHVRSVYISILWERVSMPAGKYTLGWENCRRAKLETEGRIRVHMIVHISIHVYIKVKSPVAQDRKSVV